MYTSVTAYWPNTVLYGMVIKTAVLAYRPILLRNLFKPFLLYAFYEKRST